jgi:hypothetical protein
MRAGDVLPGRIYTAPQGGVIAEAPRATASTPGASKPYDAFWGARYAIVEDPMATR